MAVLKEAMEFCESLAKALVASGQAQSNGLNVLWKRAMQAVASESTQESKAILAAFSSNAAFYKNHFNTHLKKAQAKHEKGAQKASGKKTASKAIARPSELALFVLGLRARSENVQHPESVAAAEEVVVNLCRHRNKASMRLLQAALVQLEADCTGLANPANLLRAILTYLELHARDVTSQMNACRVIALYTYISQQVQSTLTGATGLVLSLEDSIVSCAYLLRFWHRDATETTQRMCKTALQELVQKISFASHGASSNSRDPTSVKPVAAISVVAAASMLAMLHKQSNAQRLVDAPLQSEVPRALRSWGQTVSQPVLDQAVEALLACLDFGDHDSKEELKAAERPRMDDIVRFLHAAAEDAEAISEVLIHLTSSRQPRRNDAQNDSNAESSDGSDEDGEEEEEEEDDDDDESEQEDQEGDADEDSGSDPQIDEILEEDYQSAQPKKQDGDFLGFVMDTAGAAAVDELATLTEEVLNAPNTRSKRKTRAAVKEVEEVAPAEKDTEESEAPPSTRKRTRRSTRS